MMQQPEKFKKDSEVNESSLNTEEILSILDKTKNLTFLKENKIFENLSAEFKSFNLVEIAKKNSDSYHSSQKIEKNVSEKLEKELNESELEKKDILESEKVKTNDEEPKKIEKIYTLDEHEKLVNDAKEKSFKEGVQKGFEQGEKNIKDELQKGKEAHALALKNTIDNLFYVAPEFSKKLNETINESIKEICDQVLGYKISEMPKNFLKKINDLVLSIQNSSNKIVVFLNAEDQKVLNDFLENNQTLADISFKVDETLRRGDLIIKSGGIEINDISSKKFDLISDSNINESLKELANENSVKIEEAKINDIDQNTKAKIGLTLAENEDNQSKLKTEGVKNELSEDSKISSDFKTLKKTDEYLNLKDNSSNKIDELDEKIQNKKTEEEMSLNRVETSKPNDNTSTVK